MLSAFRKISFVKLQDQHFVQHPDHFDPRQYLTDGRANIKAIVAHKIKDVLGSDNKI